MVFNATFNNISAISWRSVLLVEETGENHRPVASHWQTLSHNVAHFAWSRFELTTSVVIGTDCIGSCKSNYHTTTQSEHRTPGYRNRIEFFRNGRQMIGWDISNIKFTTNGDLTLNLVLKIFVLTYMWQSIHLPTSVVFLLLPRRCTAMWFT
jgi:hypothetical protein